jgi:hypothetical protein
MKKLQLLAVAALVAVGSSTAFAQDGQRRGGGDPNAMMLQGITLSAEQQTKADSLGKSLMSAMQAVRADSTMDREAKMAKSREMRSKHVEALKCILTDEQNKILDKNVADAQARMQQGGGRPPQR